MVIDVRLHCPDSAVTAGMDCAEGSAAAALDGNAPPVVVNAYVAALRSTAR
jgi:hypothetical protein